MMTILFNPRRAMVIGGGVAGPVAGLFLQEAGFGVQVFEASPGASETGGALGLAANGMYVLAAAGVEEQVRDVSVTSSEWAFENQHGKVLVRSSAGDPQRYGHAGVMITRPALHRAVVKHAQSQGVAMHCGKRLVRIDDEPGQPVVAHFADGSCAEGDFVVGADGIGSQVRQAVMPEAPKPSYTGMMAPGGFSPCTAADVIPRSEQQVHFIFGQKGFFGYFHTVTAEGPRTAWWSTAAAPLGSKEEMAAVSKEDLQRRLMELHGDWADPVPQLIQSATETLNLAIHDMAGLPRWSAGRTVLIGDAAHAVAPHSGQGASMALEDAMLLPKLLRETRGEAYEKVFAEFEQQRRPRTDKVIALGRRNGRRKEVMSPVAYWIQQQMIRAFVPLMQARRQDWLLGYRAA
jgi:2-polyprenyl-6-methoxyphenol hydroxylase-like FAD-dependent oxidoreductase